MRSAMAWTRRLFKVVNYPFKVVNYPFKVVNYTYLPLLEGHHVHALGDGVDEVPLQGDEEGPRAQLPAPLAPPRIQKHLVEVHLGQQQTLHLGGVNQMK
jgi:hypothetical protein